MGGRILTKKFNECPLELGAMFYIENGYIFKLLKAFNLDKSILLNKDNFLSIYQDQRAYKIEDYFSSKLSDGKKVEIKKIREYVKNLDFNKDYRKLNFEEWYRQYIGINLISFWNRMLMSLGIKDMKSINAHFGLTLIFVLISGKKFLQKKGLSQLIKKLSNEIELYGGNILTNSEVKNIKEEKGKYKVIFYKNDNKKEITSNILISAVKPEDLKKIYDIDELKPTSKIKGHPLSVYAVRSNRKLWKDTWGLVITDEGNPAYILLDWTNVTEKKDEPVLIIASSLSSKKDIKETLKKLFSEKKPDFEIIYEKKWDVGLHQQDEKFFKTRGEILENLPNNFFLSGDWMILPALEGAVISGKKTAESVIKKL